MAQYCVYTRNPHFGAVLEWLKQRHVHYEVHINRTRFSIEDAQTLTEFLLKWADHCASVDPRADLVTGLLDDNHGGS